MKILYSTILVLISINLQSQILNSNFDQIDEYNGKQKPKNWYCTILSSNLGTCDMIADNQDEFSVKINNVMPCTDEGEFSFLGSGYIQQNFKINYQNFKISFDLKIDSLIPPATLTFYLTDKEFGNYYDNYVYSDSFSNKLDQNIERTINLDSNYDRLYIGFVAKGNLKENHLHNCDLGYISGIIDNLKLSPISSIKNFANNKFEIYPNPTKKIIRIESKNNQDYLKNIEFYKLDGKLIHEITNINNKMIDLDISKFDNQILILRIIDNQNNSIIKKIIKKDNS